MLIRESELRRVIRRILLEKNYPQFFKKPFDYELLISDYDSKTISDIYRKFKKSYHSKNVSIKISVDDDNAYENEIYAYEDNNISIDDYADKLRNVDRQIKLELPKSNDVIKALKNEFGFHFSKSSIEDNKPVLFIPSSEIGSFVRQNSKERVIRNVESISWVLHDMGHMEDLVDGNVFNDDTYAPGVNLKDIKTNYLKVKRYINRYLDEADKTSYWSGVIAAWMNEIGYTPDVSYRDLAPSIYAYCLSEMKSANDANNLDFRILNDDEDKVVVSHAENKWLQDFFKKTYDKVHSKSKFSRFDSEDNEGKIKDGFIYIVTLIP